MKKVLLVLALFFSLAIASYSDPPLGYEYKDYTFSIKNSHGQHLSGVTVTISDSTYIDMQSSKLVSDSKGEIIIKGIVPSDPDATPPLYGTMVVFHANGYQDSPFYLGTIINISIIMNDSI